uniref:V-type proton ATPase subunit E n=1 Tax=Dictyoglomus thermophilum TaxID=14 RepID=A0A7C3RR04_DICTH
MSIEKVLERLEKEKEFKIEELREKKEKEFTDFVTKKEKEFEEWKEQIKRELENRLKKEEETLTSQIKLKYLTESAKIETEVVYNLKSELLKRVKKLSKDKYTDIWRSILLREKINEGSILLTKGEDSLDIETLSKEFNLILREERVEGMGGFIIEKGNVIIDLTLDTILEELVNNNILDIAKILRGEM